MDRAFALYNPVEHRALTTRFGQDAGVTILGFRSWAVWCLGYPEAALTDTHQAIEDARDIGQAATLMLALSCAVWPNTFCGEYAAASSLVDELAALADEKGAAWWKASALMFRGWLFSLTRKAADEVPKQET